jgi:hypothetical protein
LDDDAAVSNWTAAKDNLGQNRTDRMWPQTGYAVSTSTPPEAEKTIGTRNVFPVDVVIDGIGPPLPICITSDNARKS